jgi:hypothetical protein
MRLPDPVTADIPASATGRDALGRTITYPQGCGKLLEVAIPIQGTSFSWTNRPAPGSRASPGETITPGMKFYSPVDLCIVKLIAVTGFENLKMEILYMVDVDPLEKII